MLYRLAIVLSLLASVASAQLSGNLTIDSSLPTGAGNYNNFLVAAAELVSQGIAGPVTFTVMTGSGTYAGFWIPGQIPGTGPGSDVTFVAGANQSPVIGGPNLWGLSDAVRLGSGTVVGSGPTWVVMDGLEITGAPTGAALMVAGCTNITVRNCTFHTSGTGVYLVASTSCLIERNLVYGTAALAATPGSNTYTGGITLYNGSSNNLVQKNLIRDTTGNGIFVGGSSTAVGSQSTNNTVINNFVSNCPGSTSTYRGGVVLRYAAAAVIANNSVWMPAGSANHGILMSSTATVGGPAEVSNNIVKHDGTGACTAFVSTVDPLPTTWDYNLYDPAPSANVGAVSVTTYPTLPAWQGLPQVAGNESNSLTGAADFISAQDLHILGSSAAFLSGVPVPAVSDDYDGDPRPPTPSIGADELQPNGLFAAFSAGATNGPAALTVSFNDLSFTNAPGGITSWSWDFQNDGTPDSFIQFPTFIYNCPGTYDVSLTVTDGVNAPSTLVRPGFVAVGDFQFSMATSGVGDLTVSPVPASCYPLATTGFTFVSFNATSGSIGQGGWFGIVPDAATLLSVQIPATPGDPLHHVVTPNTYPNTGLVLPAGSVLLPGTTMDAVQVMLDANYSIVYVSNVAQVTF